MLHLYLKHVFIFNMLHIPDMSVSVNAVSVKSIRKYMYTTHIISINFASKTGELQ